MTNQIFFSTISGFRCPGYNFIDGNLIASQMNRPAATANFLLWQYASIT
jgi:hypothetical protein